ncbi:MAG: Gfo/Idh/MocA family oxidoreductase [Acidobacteria bacterium]|nr:Gfo/Idh/MocA family oxidoreductase [Acidobacteriota bacterium]
MKRRYFLMSGAMAAARSRAVAASDKVNVAIIGVRGRGKALANEFAGVAEARVAAFVDVDETVLRQVSAGYEKKWGAKPALLGDMRRVFEDKRIDAVAMATPDHWHAPAAILACQAGKDVYVEKPCSHNIREGKLLVEASRKYKRIVQHGTQARSRASTMKAMELVHSGAIGKVLMAKAWDVQKREDIGKRADSPVPAGVDYDTWVGPAEWMPFNENRFHYKWHWNWNFGTGDVGNDGAHQMDQARWALGVDYPAEVSGMGRKLFFEDDQVTPDTVVATFSYPGKVLMFEMRIWNPYRMEGVDNGVAVYGSDGMIQVGRWVGETASFKVFDKAGKVVQVGQKDLDGGGESHVANFVSCVKSRQKPNAEIETGFQSALHCHLANIVARTGRTVKFDAATMSIPGDAEANALTGRKYRKHWGTPGKA